MNFNARFLFFSAIVFFALPVAVAHAHGWDLLGGAVVSLLVGGFVAMLTS